jgi:hypothetical protein
MNVPAFFGTNPIRRSCIGKMTDIQNPFAQYSLETAIALRWTLRDIKARRLRLSPVAEDDLRRLTELALVEIINDQPVLTADGHAVLDQG